MAFSWMIYREVEGISLKDLRLQTETMTMEILQIILWRKMMFRLIRLQWERQIQRVKHHILLQLYLGV